MKKYAGFVIMSLSFSEMKFETQEIFSNVENSKRIPSIVKKLRILAVFLFDSANPSTIFPRDALERLKVAEDIAARIKNNFIISRFLVIQLYKISRKTNSHILQNFYQYYN